MSFQANRWRCGCGANNMLESPACFQCGGPRPAYQPPPAYQPRPAYPTTVTMPPKSAGRKTLAWGLAIPAALVLLLALNNPSKGDFARWVVAENAKRVEKPKDQAGAAGQAIGALMAGPLVERQTQVTNCVVFSVFESQDLEGKPVFRAVGVLRAFIPLTPVPAP